MNETVKRLKTTLLSGEVARYHTYSTKFNCSQTVAAHSWGVALLAILLSEKPNLNMVLSALMHDATELCTGDIPAPTKCKIDEFLKPYERNFAQNNLLFASFCHDVPPLVVVADNLECLIWAKEHNLKDIVFSKIAMIQTYIYDSRNRISEAEKQRINDILKGVLDDS